MLAHALDDQRAMLGCRAPDEVVERLKPPAQYPSEAQPNVSGVPYPGYPTNLPAAPPGYGAPPPGYGYPPGYQPA